jgi:hypothetical protein
VTAKKKAASKAEPKAARPRLVKNRKLTPEPPVATPPAVEGFAHAAVALPSNVSDSMRGWRVKHHMTKYHDRPDAENPFLHLAPNGACRFCGGQL